MNYELAKLLKDAGFNQETAFQYRVDWVAGDGGMEKEEATLVYRQNYETKGTNEEGQTCGTYLISAPTLSELIEACGKDFHCLIHTIDAGVNSDKELWSAGRDSSVVRWMNGSSPESAVARLWLSLNKK